MKKLFSIILLLSLALTLAACGGDNETPIGTYSINDVSENDRALLVDVFGRQQIDMHDDFNVAPVEGEIVGGLSIIGTGAVLSGIDDAYALIMDWYPHNEWHTVNSLEFIGENDSYWCFLVDISYHDPTEREISRMLVEKNDVPIGNYFATREATLQRVEEVVNEKVDTSERVSALQRLTVVVDEMHAVSEIWATPCDCHKYR
jgi:hypothetical protein